MGAAFSVLKNMSDLLIDAYPFVINMFHDARNLDTYWHIDFILNFFHHLMLQFHSLAFLINILISFLMTIH